MNVYIMTDRCIRSLTNVVTRNVKNTVEDLWRNSVIKDQVANHNAAQVRSQMTKYVVEFTTIWHLVLFLVWTSIYFEYFHCSNKCV